MEIAQGIHLLKVPIPDNPLENLNCYIIEGKNGWLMVDTGWFTDEAFSALGYGLSELELKFTDIATIIVTHIHPDHFGLAGKIKQVSPKTELLMHRFEFDMIDSRYIKFSNLQDAMTVILGHHGVPASGLPAMGSASMPALKYVMVTFPDRTLYGGETISTGIYDLEVIWTPGHAMGHICLYEPKNRLLFSGDHILPTITSNISYHVQSGDNPLGDYIGALHKLEHISVSRVLPAHEDVFTDLRSRINELIIHHDERKDEIRQAIADKPLNAYEISSYISWNTEGSTWEQLPPLHKRAAVTETIAHLECMRWEGGVKRITEGDSILYGTV